MPSGLRCRPGTTWPHGVAEQNAQAKRNHACGILANVAERVCRVSGPACVTGARRASARMRTGACFRRVVDGETVCSVPGIGSSCSVGLRGVAGPGVFHSQRERSEMRTWRLANGTVVMSMFLLPRANTHLWDRLTVALAALHLSMREHAWPPSRTCSLVSGAMPSVRLRCGNTHASSKAKYVTGCFLACDKPGVRRPAEHWPNRFQLGSAVVGVTDAP
jgi:hypothetical protein